MSKDAHIPPGRALVVGLGNPGPKYELTRHNIGFLVADALSERYAASWTEKRSFRGHVTEAQRGVHRVTLLKPMTFMNLSGESVRPACEFWRLGKESIIVVHDDIELPPGRVRIKIGGGHGGHNGLKSIDRHLGGRDYVRVRLGVGRPELGDVSAWVLSSFTGEDRDLVIQLIERGVDAVERILDDGLQSAQNAIHALP